MTVTGKKYINARPLVFVTLAYIFGLVSALSEYMVLACICSAAAIILLVCLSKSKPVLFIVMAAIYALGFFLIYSGVLEAKYEPDNTPYILTGRICEEVEKSTIRLVCRGWRI